MKKTDDSEHISTKSVKEILKLTDCSIMHLRTEGNIRFTKKGNSYLYLLEDVKKLADISVKK